LAQVPIWTYFGLNYDYIDYKLNKMGMKYVSAYLMNVLGGKDSPSAKDVEATLSAAGLECDSALASKLCSELQGKSVQELIEKNRESLKGFGGGGGGGAAAGGGGAAAGGAAEAKKEEVVEEEEEEDMDFDLFG